MGLGLAVAVGGALIGASSSRSASKRAARASDRAAELSHEAQMAQLDFEKEKYEEWQEVYGPIQDNLAEYYSNVDAKYYEAQGLEAFEKERQAQMEALEANLAQRGITGSGIHANLLGEDALSAATNRASIRVAAPRLAAEEKRQFLQIGLGQNPGAALSQAYRDVANRATVTVDRRAAEASETARVAGRAAGDAFTTIATGLADYYTNRPQSGVEVNRPDSTYDYWDN